MPSAIDIERICTRIDPAADLLNFKRGKFRALIDQRWIPSLKLGAGAVRILTGDIQSLAGDPLDGVDQINALWRNDEFVVTAQELAARVDLSDRSIHRLHHDGVLVAMQARPVMLFRADDVRAWLLRSRRARREAGR